MTWLPLVTLVAVFATPSSADILPPANIITLDLAGYEGLDIIKGLDKASLDLKWIVTHDGKVGGGPKLLVEGPNVLKASVAAQPGSSKMALLTLNYSCTVSNVNTLKNTGLPTKGNFSGPSAVSSSSRISMWPLIIPLLLGLVLPKMQRSTGLVLLVLAIACLSFQMKGTWACTPTTTLTLVLEPQQWGEVASCGMCEKEADIRSKRFAWRPPCAVEAAAKVVDQVAGHCNFSADVTSCSDDNLPTRSCGIDGWCNSTASQSQCSFPAAVGHSCVHKYFKTDILKHTNATGTAFLTKILTCMEQHTPVPGRPYTTLDGALRAPAQWESGDCPWSGQVARQLTSMPEIVPMGLPSWSKTEALQVAEEWLRHGQEEHASIASFSRFSLDLLRFAAPPSLVEATHAAAIDEVRHAKLAFNLAARFRGHFHDGHEGHVGVGAFPVASVNLSHSLSILAERTLEEGCMGESGASAGLAFTLASLKEDSPARSALLELLADEARHAALAWATLGWTLRAGAEVKPLELKGMSIHPDSLSSAVPMPLAWGGRIPEQTLISLGALVNEVWVHPWTLALSRGERVMPDVLVPAGSLGRAVSEAATLVYKQLQKVERSEQDPRPTDGRRSQEHEEIV